jgi:hypothetical protein
MYKLEDYETVAMLNKWFIENYPMGRTNIVITYHDVEKGIITCRAEVYRDANDAYPATSNIAHGVRDLYNSNMRRFYAEDIASSSLGRAITLLKGGQTATRDDMEKVGQVESKPPLSDFKPLSKPFAEKLADKITMPVEDDPWSTKTVSPAPSAAEAIALVQESLGGSKIDDDIPSCEHGVMKFRDGVSKKNNKPWAQFSCQNPAGGFLEKCEPIWLEIGSDGKWIKQKGRA